MRTMEIRRFPSSEIQAADLESLIKERLIREVVLWPGQAVPLLGYMAWPNDTILRQQWIDAHKCEDPSALSLLLRKLKNIEQHWARVADIVHKHYDLSQGQYQERGGASVGKAISLIDANAKSKGTGAAKLWEIWRRYKDVAHLATAAILISADVQTRHRMAPFLLRLHQFQPYRMAMLLPEITISVAMSIEKYGLGFVPNGRNEPLFDPETLWRIPSDINLNPIDPPPRKIIKTDLAVLSARRARNRGAANRRTTTPVLF